MVNAWSPIDTLGSGLRNRLTVKVQMRVGVLCTLLSIPLCLVRFFFFETEPMIVFEMSAAALLITGICIVIAAAPSE